MSDLVLNLKNNECDISVTEIKNENGIKLIKLEIDFGKRLSPKPMSFELEFPMVDVYSVWYPLAGQNRYIAPNYKMQTSNSRLASGAPVLSVISKTGGNVLTVALSDADTSTAIGMGVDELTANANISIALFNEPIAPLDKYSCIVRIDSRQIPFYKSLSDVEKWWENDCGYECAHIPDAAKMPVDSLWYSFHQSLSTDEILKECRASKALGMDTVIIDDGWQTDDVNLGYYYCGEWELAKSKIPDMKVLTDELHKIGMKVMIWFSVPFIGLKSKMYEHFMGKYCTPPRIGAVCLDPRYKEVREYLADIYERAVIDWGLDGLKLDFIDSFKLTEISLAEDEKRDIPCLEDAVDVLLSDVKHRLERVNPEILIEFRQSYIGPRIRKYGNMLRVSDCPNDSVRNRIGIIDLRLISGKSAVHSDMLMWHKDDSLENIGNQLLSVMFGVPQISVRADKYPAEQMNMLKSFLSFWRTHRETLLSGELIVKNPEDNYSAIYARGDNETVAVRYSDVTMTVFDGHTHYLFNGGSDTAMTLCFEGEHSERDYTVYDCRMVEVNSGKLVGNRYQTIEVPLAGHVVIK